MAPSRSFRKRQSRLTFTPLPSSSPAAKGYNKQIQERAAAVSLDSSPGPAKRRRTGDDDIIQVDGGTDSIPTPAASMQRRVQIEVDETSGSDSEPIRSTQRRPSTQAKQQRLDFSSARDPDSFSSPFKVSSPSRPQSSARAGIFGTQRQRAVVDVSSDESDELPSPGKLMAKSKGKTKVGASKSGNGRATRSTQPITVDSESEGDNIVVSSGPANAIERESDDEDDDMPTATGKLRRKRARRASHNSFVSSSPPRAIDSDDDIQVIEKPRKRSRRNENQNEESDFETPNKRKLKRSNKALQREKDELAEDVDFLGPSSDVEDSARQPRNTQTAAKNAKQKALEKLKRRRSGLQAEAEQETEELQEEADELYEDDDDHQDDTREHPVSSRQMFREDDYDQDFVEEDEEDTLGIPDDLPLEFTRYASMKPKELFKYAVEWMVQKKINPAFPMNDGLYDLSFRKLDDEVTGLAGSKFTSAAWTPDFTVALKSRPDIAYEHLDRNAGDNWMRDSCDACNRTGHPATYQIQFQGKPYHRQTLDELGGNDDDEDSSSEDAEDADDQPDYDANGQQIPPANTIYYVGKFCMSNALTAHNLQHWRYHLYEWVVEYLTKQQYNTPEKIVRRDQMSTKNRRKEANKITDRMEQEGVIKTLWRDFHGNIDEARNSKQGRYRFESP